MVIYTLIDPNGHECNSHIPYGGYSYDTLRDMADNGFELYIDGKKAKFPTKSELEQAQKAAPKK